MIRCGYFNYTDPKTGAVTVERCDQVSFLSYGSFPHRTGTLSTSNQFADSTTAPSAFIWWGQLAMEKGNSVGFQSNDESQQLPLTQPPTGVNEGDFTLGRGTMILVPSNAASPTAFSVSPSGTSIAAFLDGAPPFTTPNCPLSAIDYYSSYTSTGHLLVNTTFGSEKSDITQSRVDAAATSSNGIMTCIQQVLALNTRATPYTVAGQAKLNSSNRLEADHFCYRRGALTSPYEGKPFGSSPLLVNGYFRTVPIIMQGVSSFAVDWTDGSVFATGDQNAGSATSGLDLTTDGLIGETGGTPSATLIGSTRWFGLSTPATGPNPGDIIGFARGTTTTPNVIVDGSTSSSGDFSGVHAVQDGFVDTFYPGAPTATDTVTDHHGDFYTAIFSFDTPVDKWPVALRFRYHVVDPTGRLPNGRDFVQVVSLPQ